MTTARVVTTIHENLGPRSRRIVVTTLAVVMRRRAVVMRRRAVVMRGGAIVMERGVMGDGASWGVERPNSPPTNSPPQHPLFLLAQAQPTASVASSSTTQRKRPPSRNRPLDS